MKNKGFFTLASLTYTLTSSALAADINGTIIFSTDIGKSASIVLLDAANTKHEAKLAQEGGFAFNRVAVGDSSITIKVGRQVFEIPRMWIDEGTNEITLYYPTDMTPDVRAAGAEAGHRRGSQLLQAGEYAEAISQLTLALTHDTAQSPTWGSMALCYVGLGRLEDAVFCGKMAIRFDPTESSYWNNLGSTYYRMRRFSEAVTLYERAADLNPAGSGLYYSNAGAAHFAMDNTAAAISAYEKAVKAEGCPPGSWFHLGSLLARTGENAPAASALREYLSRQPTGQYAESAKRMLQGVSG